MVHRQTLGLDCGLHGTNSRADPLVDVYFTVGIYKVRLGAAKSVRGGRRTVPILCNLLHSAVPAKRGFIVKVYDPNYRYHGRLLSLSQLFTS